MGHYCPKCGEPTREHDLDPHSMEPTICPDRAFTQGSSPDGSVSVMNGERVGRRRGDY